MASVRRASREGIDLPSTVPAILHLHRHGEQVHRRLPRDSIELSNVERSVISIGAPLVQQLIKRSIRCSCANQMDLWISCGSLRGATTPILEPYKQASGMLPLSPFMCSYGYMLLFRRCLGTIISYVRTRHHVCPRRIFRVSRLFGPFFTSFF
jgi:hypothetical protein